MDKSNCVSCLLVTQTVPYTVTCQHQKFSIVHDLLLADIGNAGYYLGGNWNGLILFVLEISYGSGEIQVGVDPTVVNLAAGLHYACVLDFVVRLMVDGQSDG